LFANIHRHQEIWQKLAKVTCRRFDRKELWHDSTYSASRILALPRSLAGVIFIPIFLVPAARAQNPQLQERVAEIKQSMAQNKQALAQYTWQEQETISIKGEVKKQKLFQVQIGPNGKPQKTEIDAPSDSSDGGRKHGLKHRIKEEKKEEYEDYGKEIAELAQGYIQ
jgi:hypothetical protein